MSHEENLDVAVAEPEVESCNHHWLIGAPEGPVSAGVCKNCGIDKEFKNLSLIHI